MLEENLGSCGCELVGRGIAGREGKRGSAEMPYDGVCIPALGFVGGKALLAGDAPADGCSLGSENAPPAAPGLCIYEGGVGRPDGVEGVPAKDGGGCGRATGDAPEKPIPEGGNDGLGAPKLLGFEKGGGLPPALNLRS